MYTVCIVATASFLAFSQSVGNALSTSRHEFGFPGLRPGDRWRQFAARWQEALEAGAAPSVIVGATHEFTLEFCSLDDLRAHVVDASELPGASE